MPFYNCDYVGRSAVCGKRCYATRCRAHRGKVSLTPCKLCGTGTASATGYCAHRACSWRQNDVGHKLSRERRAAAAETARAAAELDRQLLELLG